MYVGGARTLTVIPGRALLQQCEGKGTQVFDTVTVVTTWVPFPRGWTPLAGDDT
jgi:hypothetical protein